MLKNVLFLKPPFLFEDDKVSQFAYTVRRNIENRVMW